MYLLTVLKLRYWTKISPSAGSALLTAQTGQKSGPGLFIPFLTSESCNRNLWKMSAMQK